VTIAAAMALGNDYNRGYNDGKSAGNDDGFQDAYKDAYRASYRAAISGNSMFSRPSSSDQGYHFTPVTKSDMSRAGEPVR